MTKDGPEVTEEEEGFVSGFGSTDVLAAFLESSAVVHLSYTVYDLQSVFNLEHTEPGMQSKTGRAYRPGSSFKIKPSVHRNKQSRCFAYASEAKDSHAK